MELLQEFLQTLVLNPLRPYLLPIATSLPEAVNSALISLLGDHCFATLVLALDVTKEPACFPLAISKALGLAIVTLSAIVKVPQIVKLLGSRSAQGVSFTAYALETTSLLITLAYSARQNFPFSTYGESALIAAQDVVVAVLVLLFSGQGATAGAFLAAVAGVVYTLLFSGETIIDNATMSYLQAGAGVLAVASKLPQIWTVWKEGTTGQLSAFAVFNYLLGSLSRIFTTIQEVDDSIILYSFVASFSLNLILALQMLYYWRAPSPSKGHKQTPRFQIMKEVKVTPIESTDASTSTTKSPSTRRRG